MKVALIIAVISALGFLIPRVVLPYFVKGQTLTRELMQGKGRPAQALILQIRDTGVTLNENPQVEFSLEVRPEGASPYQAQTTALVSRLSVQKYQPGAIISVLYDPSDPSRVAVIGG